MTFSRLLEDVGFLAAIGLGVYAGVKEANALHVAHHFPWALLIVMSILAAPKTLGRASAGKVWERLADMLPSKKP